MNIVEPIRDRGIIAKIEEILIQKSERDLLLFVMGTNTGLRVSDILALNVNDVKNKDYVVLFEKKTGKYKNFLLTKRLKRLYKNILLKWEGISHCFKQYTKTD